MKKTFTAEPPLVERIRARIEHEVDTRSVRIATALIRLTKGRVVRLWGRQALLLTTRGRRSGKERTVPLQLFEDGDDMIVLAANSGLPKLPGWYFNLRADPQVRVEVGGRGMRARAEELPQGEAAVLWPRILREAPEVARYPRRTTRRIPMIRLVPVGRVEGAPAGGITSRNRGAAKSSVAALARLELRDSRSGGGRHEVLVDASRAPDLRKRGACPGKKTIRAERR